GLSLVLHRNRLFRILPRLRFRRGRLRRGALVLVAEQLGLRILLGRGFEVGLRLVLHVSLQNSCSPWPRPSLRPRRAGPARPGSPEWSPLLQLQTGWPFFALSPWT